MLGPAMQGTAVTNIINNGLLFYRRDQWFSFEHHHHYAGGICMPIFMQAAFACLREASRTVASLTLTNITSPKVWHRQSSSFY
jgi:hypothetical protein